ncbi:hypothetical protein [Aeromicrobium halocynthiae]|uniref:hypothetical protein n=1 Tax=Aeromicrobium halocynthiae TaxID=560557 RepID=UPI0031DDAC99
MTPSFASLLIKLRTLALLHSYFLSSSTATSLVEKARDSDVSMSMIASLIEGAGPRAGAVPVDAERGVADPEVEIALPSI